MVWNYLFTEMTLEVSEKWVPSVGAPRPLKNGVEKDIFQAEDSISVSFIICRGYAIKVTVSISCVVLHGFAAAHRPALANILPRPRRTVLTKAHTQGLCSLRYSRIPRSLMSL